MNGVCVTSIDVYRCVTSNDESHDTIKDFNYPSLMSRDLKPTYTYIPSLFASYSVIVLCYYLYHPYDHRTFNFFSHVYTNLNQQPLTRLRFCNFIFLLA